MRLLCNLLESVSLQLGAQKWYRAVPGLPKIFPFEGMGLTAEDFIKIFNKMHRELEQDPLGYLTNRKTLVKMKRNMQILEELGMDGPERKTMVLGTPRLFEVRPSALSAQIEFYNFKLRLKGVELRKYLVGFPHVLNESIDNHISPRVSVYKALGIRRAQLRRMVLLYPQLLTLKLDDHLLPSMRALARCQMTLVQGLSVLRNFPQIVGMPHDMIKTTVRLLHAHYVENEDIVRIYKKAASVRLDTSGRFGRGEVKCFVTRTKKGTKVGVIVMREGILLGFRFRQLELKKYLDTKGIDWEPVWSAIEAQREAIRNRRSTAADQSPQGGHDETPQIMLLPATVAQKPLEGYTSGPLEANHPSDTDSTGVHPSHELVGFCADEQLRCGGYNSTATKVTDVHQLEAIDSNSEDSDECLPDTESLSTEKVRKTADDEIIPSCTLKQNGSLKKDFGETVCSQIRYEFESKNEEDRVSWEIESSCGFNTDDEDKFRPYPNILCTFNTHVIIVSLSSH